MKDGTRNIFLKRLGLSLFLAFFALSHVHCGTAECGGTETGNPSTCTSNDPTTTGEDTGSTTGDSDNDDASDETGEDGDSFDSAPGSDNDLSATFSLSDPLIETLAYGHDADSNISAAKLVFTNESDFTAFWEEFFGEDVEKPEVDFSVSIVAAAVMGVQDSGGFSLAFTNQRIEDGTLILTLTEIRPGADCGVTESLTNPYHVVNVPTSGEDISIETELIEDNCD